MVKTSLSTYLKYYGLLVILKILKMNALLENLFRTKGLSIIDESLNYILKLLNSTPPLMLRASIAMHIHNIIIIILLIFNTYPLNCINI